MLYDTKSKINHDFKNDQSDGISLDTDHMPQMHEFDEEWPIVSNRDDSKFNLQNYKSEKHSQNMIDHKALSRNLDVRAGFSDGNFPLSDRKLKDFDFDDVSNNSSDENDKKL